MNYFFEFFMETFVWAASNESFMLLCIIVQKTEIDTKSRNLFMTEFYQNNERPEAFFYF